jgi:hypothetical protein
MFRPHRLAWVIVLAFLAGCSSLPPEEQAKRDRVLNENREALTQLRAGNYAAARPLLDDVVTTLGGVTAGDRSAREARSYFKEESRKNFRGEPYERVMAYYYRGILYWMDGEPDNARACFRTAALQDADPEQHQFDCDYVLLDYLDGLVSEKLSGGGDDAFKRALKSVRGATPPAYDKTVNVMVFAEMGRGPSKYAAGEHGEQLHFSPGTTTAVAAKFRVDPTNNLPGISVPVPVYDDLTYQATTRGGRQMDYILANKAVFKDTTDNFGNAALVSGAILATQGGRGSNLDEIGAGLLVAGLLSKVVSAATTPAADTRCWDSLPNLLGFAALKLPPGRRTGTIEFLGPGGQVTASRQVSFDVALQRDTVLFLSDRNQ